MPCQATTAPQKSHHTSIRGQNDEYIDFLMRRGWTEDTSLELVRELGYEGALDRKYVHRIPAFGSLDAGNSQSEQFVYIEYIVWLVLRDLQ